MLGCKDRHADMHNRQPAMLLAICGAILGERNWAKKMANEMDHSSLLCQVCECLRHLEAEKQDHQCHRVAPCGFNATSALWQQGPWLWFVNDSST